MSAGWVVFMLFAMVLFVAVVVAGIVWIIRSSQAPRPPAALSPPSGNGLSGAEQILADRLARGEIEPEEYQARLAALRTPR